MAEIHKVVKKRVFRRDESVYVKKSMKVSDYWIQMNTAEYLIDLALFIIRSSYDQIMDRSELEMSEEVG